MAPALVELLVVAKIIGRALKSLPVVGKIDGASTRVIVAERNDGASTRVMLVVEKYYGGPLESSIAVERINSASTRVIACGESI